jgi:DNA-3-methyladenine glycosylase II
VQRLDARSFRAACDRLAGRERGFAEVIDRFGYPRFVRRPPGFATLARIIIEQQVSLDSARAVCARLDGLAGGIRAEAIHRLTPDTLCQAGLTRARARYIAALAQRVVGEETSFARISRATEEDARRMLLEIPGVGPWSADVYLLFAARLADVWPRGDLALRRSIAEVFGPEPTAVAGDAGCAIRAEAWRPWRSAAARLLWHAYLSRRGRLGLS